MDKTLVAGCIRQVVVLYQNDCMGLDLDELNVGYLIRGWKLKAASGRDIKEHFISYERLIRANLTFNIFTLFLIK